MLRRQAEDKKGGVLVEFALVAFAMYLLLAAILDLGRIVLAGQLVQSAADQMARELAMAPLPATMTFEEALESDYVRQRIYDPTRLVVELGPGFDIEAAFATFPIINQMLRPLLVADVVNGVSVLRYPGAVVEAGDGYRILIPRISVSADSGVDLIEWLPVVEEILPDASAQSHFPVNAPLEAFRGNVILRINYPFQAATMSAFDPSEGGGPLAAAIDAPAPGSFGATPLGAVVETTGSPSVRGAAGLGYQFAMVGESAEARRVLPYRKLIRARSFHRREIYGP